MDKKNRAVVLCSGGVDSAVCLSLVVGEFGAKNVLCVSFDYGQRHLKEIECSKKLADFYKCQHKIISLKDTNIFTGSNCPLINSSKKIPEGSYEEQKRAENGMVATYVPYRNGLFISCGAAMGLSTFANADRIFVYVGVHADDAAGNAYADCSKKFIQAISKAVSLGTYGKVDVIAPFVSASKARVVKVGLALSTPFQLTWSCYKGGDKPCGVCGTCIDRQKAFEANKAKDPLLLGKE